MEPVIVTSSDARTTVFCAVWSGDPQRRELLARHQANLEALTTPVAALTVFDGGDEAPEWVRGTRIVAGEPLTIYQAWNVATQVVSTELLMNLNLDDRLFPDGVRVLEDALTANAAAMAAGDWRIVFSHDEAEDVGDVYPASRLGFDRAWPPRAGFRGRLGSGTHDRGTFGPAVMWRRDLHGSFPYPWEFTSGEPIRSAGDLAWWTIVQHHLRKPVVRVPVVIGNYLSRPATQAEFRAQGELDLLKGGVGLNPYPLDGLRVVDDPS